MKASLSLAVIFSLLVATPCFAVDTSAPTDAQILHVLNRLSYGPSPGDIDNVRKIGIKGYIDQQLNPSALPPSSALQEKLSELPTLNMTLPELMENFIPEEKIKDLPPDEKKEYRKREYSIVEQLSQAKIMRALLSPAQLQEVMTDFWFNHFNVFAKKGLVKIFIGGYERDAIRPYALGKFRDLLFATAAHPAMIVYLDNVLNTDPNSPIARGKKIGINENYAREVMELHTLGINGGYTQGDVTTLAHILTGWGLGEGGGREAKAQFFFDARRHDFANKEFLGTEINGSGVNEITQVLDMLARSPATAHHISFQLAQYFVADEPPKSLVDRLTATFESSGGDIAAVLKTLFYSDEFWDPKYEQVKFKPPFRYIVSVLRANGAVPPGDTKILQMQLKNMGEPLYHCLTPNGYSITNDQWLNSDALLKRIDFTKQLAGFLDTGSVQTVEASFGHSWTPNTLTTVQNATDPEEKLQLLMSSPEVVFY